MASLDVVSMIAVFLVGTCFGSFLGLVRFRCLDRTAGGLFWPPSHCDHCGRTLTLGELIPVLGWLMCGGACRRCGGRVPWQYPALELVFGVAALFGMWTFGF